MSGLIFKRDLENPLYHKHDSILSYKFGQTDTSISNSIDSFQSQSLSPRSKISPKNVNLTMSQDPLQPKRSLPNALYGLDIIEASSKPKPKVRVIQISKLYSGQSESPSHKRNRRTWLPLIKIRNPENSPLPSTFRSKDNTQKEQGASVSKNRESNQTIGSTSNTSRSMDKDTLEHKKFVNYLSYLDKTNRPNIRAILKKKFQKSVPIQVKEVSDPLSHLNPYFGIVSDSLTSIPRDNFSSKVLETMRSDGILNSRSNLNIKDSSAPTSKEIGNEEIGGSKEKLLDVPSAKQKRVSRQIFIQQNLGLKEIKDSGVPTFKDIGNEESGVGSKEKLLDVSHSKHKRTSRQILTHQNFGQKGFHNNYESLFKVLAQNLNELYNIFSNDKKVQRRIELLAENKLELLQLLSVKAHKIHNFDANKLEQYFSMIEFSSEHLSIPAKLNKIKQGIIIVDPSLIKEFQKFSTKLEELVIKKKKDQLKQIQDRLIQTEDNLQEILIQKLRIMKKNNKLKQYTQAKEIINDRPPLGSYYYSQKDPIAIIEEHKKYHGDLGNIKDRNLEHARGLQEIFSAWQEHVGHE